MPTLSKSRENQIIEGEKDKQDKGRKVQQLTKMSPKLQSNTMLAPLSDWGFYLWF